MSKSPSKVVDYAHERGISVEGEIGVLGGIEDGHGAGGSGLDHVTDPDQAVEFAELHRRGFAGHRHRHQPRRLQVHQEARWLGAEDGPADRDPQAPAQHPPGDARQLSSVPKDLQDIINQYGGKLKETWGVPVEEIQLGIKNGVRKINVDTDNRLAITGAIRKVFAESPEKFDPRDYMKPARAAMQKVVAQRMTQFGQAGHAGDYTAISIADMAKGYAKRHPESPSRWSPPSNFGCHREAGKREGWFAALIGSNKQNRREVTESPRGEARSHIFVVGIYLLPASALVCTCTKADFAYKSGNL